MTANTIEFEDLLKIYDEETVEDIVDHWQNDPFTHPMVCYIHNDTLLKYEQGQLYCPEPGCQFHEHWIPIAVVNYWNEVDRDI